MSTLRPAARPLRPRFHAIGLLVALGAAPFIAHAAEPTPPLVSDATASRPKAAPRGVVVVALDGGTDAAWALAREVYARPYLQPFGVDDARARALAGEVPAADAPQDVQELAQLRAGVKGDDAASRQLLAAIAVRVGARAVVVVGMDGAKASARVFVADTGAFDAARYAPDDSPLLSWHGTVQSLERSYGATLAPVGSAPATSASAAPSAALREGPRIENAPPAPKKFYESAWFWGAIGGALFAGGAVFFATRDNSSGTIHLQMQAPK
jgi:hypothetical protein